MPHASLESAHRSLCSGLVMTETRFRQAFLLLLVTAISAAFVAMIRAFLLTILLAAIFAGLSYPVYRWVLGRAGGRSCGDRDARAVAGAGDGTTPGGARGRRNEALRVTETIRPRLEQLVDQPGEFDSRLRALPGYDRIEPQGADPHQGRRASWEHERVPLLRTLRDHTRNGGLHLSFLCIALHDVFLPHRGSGLASRRSRVPATHRGRQATHGREVRVGHARDAQGHDLDRCGSGPSWRFGVLGRGY